MKRTVYITCGQVFATLQDALSYVASHYTLAQKLDGQGQVREKNCVYALRQMQAGEYSPVPCSLKLPSSVSLQSRMRPVRNQASRGTCAANAGAALMEYYTGGKWDFSVQYLFERMKCIEHMLTEKASLDEGSDIRYVFAALEQYGVCREEFWPYAREQIDERAVIADWRGRDVPPGADEDAKRHRLCDKPYIFSYANNVEEIKKYLAGSIQHAPMPVYVGAKTFSDGNTILPLENGFVTLPKLVDIKIQEGVCNIDKLATCRNSIDISAVDMDSIKEVKSIEVLDMTFEGYHAMLLVGYEDDGQSPGGGYFIVRNSWGGDWGENGYGKMPYAYVELFVISAGTIIAPPNNEDGLCPDDVSDGVPEELRVYLGVADRDMKNSRGLWKIEKGMKVIVDADGVAEQDTALNRKKFIEQGFSWSGKSSVNAADAGGGQVAVANGPQNCGRFISGVEMAFKRLTLDFPLLGGIKKGGLFSSRPKVESFKKVADLSDRLGDRLNIYEATGGKHCFRVALVYLESPADAGTKAENARQLVDEYNASRKFNPADCTIIAIGASGTISGQVQPYLADSDVRIVLDGYSAGSGWRVSLPDKPKDDSWHEWVKRLVPNMPDQWRTQLADVWSDIAVNGGHVTLEKMSARIGIPKDELETFIADYMSGYKVKGGNVVKA